MTLIAEIYLRFLKTILKYVFRNIFEKDIRELKSQCNMTQIAEICHFAQTNQPSIEGSIECNAE